MKPYQFKLECPGGEFAVDCFRRELYPRVGDKITHTHILTLILFKNKKGTFSLETVIFKVRKDTECHVIRQNGQSRQPQKSDRQH